MNKTLFLSREICGGLNNNSYSQGQSVFHSNSYFQETTSIADWSLTTSSQMKNILFLVTHGNAIFLY